MFLKGGGIVLKMKSNYQRNDYAEIDGQKDNMKAQIKKERMRAKTMKILLFTMLALVVAVGLALPVATLVLADDTGLHNPSNYEDNTTLAGLFRTQTQGGWGTKAHGNNLGVYRDANFDAVFPTDLLIGVGPIPNFGSASFTTSAAIEDFLPAKRTPAVLDENYIDPLTTSGGILAGQTVALTLNVYFDYYDPGFSVSTTNLKDLVVADATSTCYGMTVERVLFEANQVLAGMPTQFTAREINDCVAAINENFVDGETDLGFLRP